jgi:serine/threonine protein kinase/tetratricopeptide (TPR) repeat protein
MDEPAQNAESGLPREAALFQAAAQLTGSDRAAFLDRACGGDTALRRRLEALLAAREQTEGVLTESATEAKGTMKVELADAPDETVGQKIGRYKILEKVGEGGCGVVYVAEQTEPVRRRVALKVIKLGMDTRQVVARFEAERQALAMMDHPNIAKVLDAGATESGRPYFIMELVRGIRITDYCDQNKLPTNKRLELFINICQAIQHAHQKGIIHRDIKPSNILVTLHDGVPVPKVIDFGIAKATTDQRLTDKTVYTQLQQFVGTPAYMSPEQAEMSGLDVDTRSDIYSLGVLLYELLTGATPFDADELMSQGIDAMRKTIREREPLKPSTKVHTLQGADLTTTAKRHGVDVPKLVSQLRGDLDWIVMKCLEKDRTRRYETANGLAMDIKRHLSNETVVARPPSKLYEFQKTVRRHKVGFAATAAVIVVLAAGIVMTTWQAVRATQAKQEALAAEANEARLRQQAEDNERKAMIESAKNKQTAQFLSDIFASVGPSVAMGRDTTLIREMLDKNVARMSKELAGQPLVEANLRGQLGWTYYQLGDYAKAEELLRQALALVRNDANDEHTAKGLHTLSLILWRESKLTEAESAGREALSIRRKLFGEESKEVAQSLTDLALVLETQGKFAQAEGMYREALTTRRKLLGNENADVAWSLFLLGMSVEAQGRLAEAEGRFREALAIRRTLYGPKHPEVAHGLTYLGIVLQREGKLTEAESTLHEAIAMQKELLPPNHPDTMASAAALAVVLDKQGKLAEAAMVYRQAADHGNEFSQARLARLYAGGQGVSRDMAEAAKWYRKAIEKLRPLAESGDAAATTQLAWLLATCDVPELRDGAGAVRMGEKAVSVTDRKYPDALEALAAAYAETGQFDKAVATEKEAIAALTAEHNKQPLESRLKLYEAKTPCRDSEQTD